MIEIKSEAEWLEVLKHSETEPVVIFKQSITCPVSQTAYEEMLVGEDKLEAPIYLIIIQSSRELSNLVAEELGVRHQSPQVIVIKDRQAIYDESHFKIGAKEVAAKIKAAK